MPRIAVIIPTYNRAHLLKRAMDSVLAQAYSDFELIVVDDGSEDDTAQVVQGYRNCRYIKITHSGLPAAARNAGIRASEAEFVAFLDSDDQWLPAKLDRQVSLLERDRGTGLICSNAIRGDSNEPYLRADQGRSGRVFTALLDDNFVITSTVLMRRELLDRLGFFSESVALEDYELWLRVAAAAEIRYLSEPLAVYSPTDGSYSKAGGEAIHWLRLIRLFEHVRSLDSGGSSEAPGIIDRQSAAFHRSLCDAYLRAHNYREFAASLIEFARMRPVPAAKYALARTLLIK